MYEKNYLNGSMPGNQYDKHYWPADVTSLMEVSPLNILLSGCS
jgi:hypothetical protein